MVEYSLGDAVSGRDLALSEIARDFAAGRELGAVQRLMAMSGCAQATRDYYGPAAADMRITPPELPENVKGMLASRAV